ncbi:MAG: type I secretion system permease/ATPase [Amphiplicatus sp.]
MADALYAARRHALEAAGFSFFVNLLMLTGPLYMLQIYDRVLSSRSYETLAVITLLTVMLFAAMALLDFVRGALLSRSASEFERRLKRLTFDFSIEATRRTSTVGDQPLRDLRQIRQFVAGPALTAVFDAPWTPLFLLIVFMMHWLLGVVALVGLIVLLVMAVINERQSRAANASAQSLTGEADRVALASIRNASAVDAMGMRGALRSRWSALSEAADDQVLQATDVIGGMTAASKAFRLFLQSAILGTGAYLAINDVVSPGAMIAASIISGRALAPVEVVTGQWRGFAMALSAYKRLKTYIGSAGEERERTALPAPSGALAIEKLYCQPGGAKRPVLKNLSFGLAAGEALGVIGPSAAGKSTLARAIVGVENIASGEIRLDGASLAQWSRDALGAHVGFMPQEVELFAGTAAQNIARFTENPPHEAIIAAAMAAGAHEMILGFPDGYDSEIGDRGQHLSAGQRQRLGLARALYGDPVLVVLDEPNSNLDADGETALGDAVKSLKARGATTVIVAHRQSAVAFVDKLLVLADGEIRAFGPRDEILAKIAPKPIALFKRPEAEGGAANG